MKSRNNIGFLTVVAVCVATLTSAAAQSPGGDLTRLLPTARQSKDWMPKGAPKRLTGEQIYDYMDGAGEIALACDYKALAVQEYAGKAGGVITIELYDMGNSANAFGLFSMKRLPGGRIVPMGPRNSPIQAQAGYDELLCHKGRYTVLLFGDASKTVKDADLLALGKMIVGAIKEEGTLPDLLRWLPEEGYAPGTAKYFRGKAAMDTVKFVREDVFRMKARPEAATATYVNPPGRLLVVRYNSPAEAAAALHAAQQATDTKGMTFVQQRKFLGAAWSKTGKSVDAALVERLKRRLLKPGALVGGLPPVR